MVKIAAFFLILFSFFSSNSFASGIVSAQTQIIYPSGFLSLQSYCESHNSGGTTFYYAYREPTPTATGSCKLLYAGVWYYEYWEFQYSATVSCPANSTGTTVCTCTDPYIPDATATSCISPLPPECPAAGTVQSTGFYDLGTVESAFPKITTCNSSNCEANYSGSGIVARSLVSGIYHYYSKGAYTYNGASCAAGSPNTSVSAFTTVAGSTCAAGQSFIHMNGVDKCLDSSTGAESSPYSASSVAAAQTVEDAAIAKAIADAETAAIAAGLTDTGIEAAKSAAAALVVNSYNMPSSDLGFAPDDPLNAFCVQNPLADICKINQVQAKAAGALPDIGAGSWYTKIYPEGVKGVLVSNFNILKSTPLFGLLNNITPTISGAAFNGCFSIEVFNVGMQTLCIPEGVLIFISICILLTALFAARSIIFGG